VSAPADVPLPVSTSVERRQMDFTRRQFWRGAWASWVIFMISLAIALITVGLLQSGAPFGPPLGSAAVFLLYGIPMGGMLSLIAMFIGAPVAWGIGRLLLRTDSFAWHLTAYAALGGAVGASVIVIAQILSRSTNPVMGAPFALAIITVCALSVAGGWVWTFARSRAERSF
jgi:cation transport ATPase